MSTIMQAVIITLTDGRKLTFTGPVQVSEADQSVGVRIRSIVFSEPQDLPCDYYFEVIENKPKHQEAQ